MSAESVNVNDRLRLGIEAARVGQNNKARAHLVTVLRQDPHHISALLWLAFVLPSPQDSIRVLERVLTLDPHNEQAKAGLHWARERQDLNSNLSDLEKSRTRPTPPPTIPIADHKIIPPDLPSKTRPNEPKPRALAHRSHYPFPLLLTLIIVGVLGIIAIGLGALIFVPPDTLATWLPLSTPAAKTDAAGPALAAKPTPFPTSVIKTFNSATNTISLSGTQLGESSIILPDPPAQPAASKPSSDMVAPAPLAQIIPSVVPSLLIGPELLLTTVDRSQLAYQPTYSGEKWIEVNVTTQQVTAWEGETPVMSFVVSTGLPRTPTVLGKFNIYWKLESSHMSGPGYYLPNVPYTMYFYKGYALHGTYWHNNFGQPMSHSCVNLPTDNAKKLFEWADPVIPAGKTQVVTTAENPGTLVVVHE